MVPAALGINPVFGAIRLKSLSHRGRRRDRIPGGHGGAAIHAAQCCRAVAVHKYLVADLVAALHAYAQRYLQMLAGKITPQMQCLHIGGEQFFFALVLLGKQFFQHLGLYAQQHGKCADVNDVLEELTLARVRIDRIGNLGQRHADDLNVIAELRRWQGPRAVIKQVAARLQLGHVCVPGLRIHRHHHVDATAPPLVALVANTRFIPGRQALDVAGKDIARADRHAHTQNSLGKQLIGRG